MIHHSVYCSKYDCKYNTFKYCTAVAIDVNDKAECKTYAEKVDGYKDKNFKLEVGQELKPSLVEMQGETIIKCTATKCTFNKEELCDKFEIDVGSSGMGAECKSFER
ncbi:MAG: DUF1540 domain-containing protein [Firmicutes bacterium]|nr:DUF1540 domain-containing protein [Bacillota bacterium]